MVHVIDEYYENIAEPNKGCLLALRKIILQQDTLITEAQKWGMPCFCYKNRIFCYLSMDRHKNLPYLMMVEGRYLDIPILETGKRTKMKVLIIDSSKDIPLNTINDILQTALNLYRSATPKIKTK